MSNWKDAIEQTLVEDLDKNGRVNSVEVKARVIAGGVTPNHKNSIGGIFVGLTHRHRLVRTDDHLKGSRGRKVFYWRRALPVPTTGPEATAPAA